ncbi:MAG: glycosyltransferase [Bacteroidales bacterium]|nr:glycosyltransferase [Bacteroidales bacterium]
MTFTIHFGTACYQAEALIERTMRSVCEQTYPHIEYWIMDGASTDGTLAKVAQMQKAYPKRRIHLCSEHDRGLYDAMNKGLLKVGAADFVCFLNAGDTLPASDTVARVAAQLAARNTLPKIIYGDTMLTDMDGHVLGPRAHRPPQKLTPRSFRRGMLVCHQAIWVDPRICAFYDWQHYPTSADFDWVLNALEKAQPSEIFNSGLPLAHYLVGGYSAQHEVRSWKERYRIMVKHYGPLSTWSAHIYIILRRIYRNLRRNHA